MKKYLLILALIALSTGSFAQGRIRIAYVDMEYILEKLPEYQTALRELENKAGHWKGEIEKRTKEIADAKQELEQEKVLLTKELLQEKQEEIAFKEKELLKYQLEKFGPEGDYILQKQRLVTPVQDRVFGAVTKLIKTAKYDIVFDQSNDKLGLIYTSQKLDISDKILKLITKDRKKEDRKKASKERKEKKERALTEAQKSRKELMEKKKKEREEKRKKALEERKKKREALKKKKEETLEKKKKEAEETDKKPSEEKSDKKEDIKKPEKKNDADKSDKKETDKETYGNQLTPEQLKKFQEKSKKLTPEELAAKRKKEREERRQRILEERRKKKEEKNKKDN